MAASQDECVAQYPRQQCCLDRNYSRLLSWAGYITAQPLPPDTETAPDKAWVQQRTLAEQLPASAMSQAVSISAYLLEVPNITARIRDHLNPWNDEATEAELAADIDSSLATVMPKYAALTVSDQEVAAWCDRNGYPRPDGLSNVFPPVARMVRPAA